MKPVDPQVEGCPTIVFAKDQPEYLNLPAAMVDPQQGQLYTKWEPTDEERRALAAGAAVELWVWTFGRALQPVALAVEGVREEEAAVAAEGKA